MLRKSSVVIARREIVNRKNGAHQGVTLCYVIVLGENTLYLYKLKRAPETREILTVTCFDT